MALTREQVQSLIAASERLQSDEWEAFGSSDDELYTIESPHGQIASYVDLDSSDFIAQSRNLMPQLARDWLQKDAENRIMREALERVTGRTGNVMDLEIEWVPIEVVHEIREFARQALADIDAGSGAEEDNK